MPMRRLLIYAVVSFLATLFVCAQAVSEHPATEIQRSWWAYQPISNPRPPNIASGGEGLTDIDRFILAKLAERGLSLAPRADRRAWIRRAKFALVGLPPTPEEVDAFLHDARPEAYQCVIDRWLSSPQFGEHWGRYWLDTVRYTDYLNPRSDDSPEEGDVELFEAYRYRDWVVTALNRDIPFDKFIVQQIAGDQLPVPPDKEINVDGLVATSMLTIGVWDNGDADKSKIVSDIVDDQINVVGQAFLGLTLACARCHDHKYDPISTEDYYGLAGIFYSTRTLKALGSVGLSTIAMHVPLVPNDYVEKRDSQLARLKQLDNALKTLFPSEQDKLDLTSATTRVAVEATTWNQALRILLEQVRENLQQSLLPAPPTALAVQEGGTPEGLFPRIGDVPVHIGGRYDQQGKVVPRHLPTFFCGTKQAPITKGSGRIELAHWVASPHNPLTPRVIVNRVWLKLFGQGLVTTPNNFGLLGQPPSHAELLDWLTSRFLEQRWSLKQLIRMIMLSETYCQSALESGNDPAYRKALAMDPSNRWLARFPSRRLSAEELRDSMLSVAGRLDLQAGGKATADLNRPRRTLYIQTVRADRRNFTTLFDAADPSQCVGQRNVTTVAPQALFLLNNAFVTDNAKYCAARLQSEVPNGDRPRIERAYEIVLGRCATEKELSIGEQFLAAAVKKDASAAWSEYIHVLFCTSEFSYVD
jgi:hypothetical protein